MSAPTTSSAGARRDLRAWVTLGAAVLALTASAVARAQTFTQLGAVSLVPIEAPPERLGVDGTGHAYDFVSVQYPAYTMIGFTCYALAKPEAKVTVMHGTGSASLPSASASIVIATDGDGAFVPPSGWFSCRDALAGGAQTPTPLPLPAEGRVVVAPRGDICQWSTANSAGLAPWGRVECYDRLAPAPAWEVRLDTATLDEALGVEPWSDSNPTGLEPPKYPCGLANCAPVLEGWQLLDARFLPDGRLAVIARRTTMIAHARSYEQGEHDFVLAVDPDGAVSALIEPAPPLREAASSTLGPTLVWDAGLGGLVIGPLKKAEWSNDLVPLGNDGVGNIISGPRGPGGAALIILPLDRPGLGVLSLTEALVPRAPAGTRPEDVFGIGIEQGPAGLELATPYGRFALDLDEGALDLDADGLTRAQEATLGTSDWTASSDGAISTDTRELLAGADPRDPSDDPGLRVVEPTTLVPSPLWAMHARGDGDFLRSFAAGAEAPLCRGGFCWDAAGRVVGGYDGRATALGADGAHVALVEPEVGVVTVAIADGTRTALATPEALAAVVAPDLIVPVDAEGAFAVQRAGPPKVAWLEAGQAPRLVFELPAAVGVSADDLRELPKGELVVIGYAHASEALLVRARTTWREHLWAIRAGGEVVALGRMTGGEVVYPDWTASYGDGVLFNAAARVDDLGLRGWIGPLLTPELDSVPTTLETPPFLPYAPIPAWGTVLGIDPELGGLEMVRVPRRAVPGELYVWGRSGPLRQVPRGGLVPLFEEGDLGWHGGVTGLALSAGYALCAVHHGRGEVRVLVPITADGPPIGEGGRLTIPGARDCGWGRDGSLWVLAVGEDPGVWVRPAAGGEPTRREDVTVGEDPLRFVTPSPFEGTPEVLDRATGVCGRLVTRAGHAVEVDCATGTLTFAGQPVALSGPSTFRGLGGEVVLAERADGRLVATRGERAPGDPAGADGPWIIDFEGGRVFASWAQGSGAGFGVAVRPGPALDPWTGSPARTLPRPEGLEVPTVPEAPSGGERIHLSIDGPCSGGGATGAWLVLAALALAWRRPRSAR